MWITIGAEGLTNDMVADAFTLEPGGIVPFIDQANHLIEQIATISRTPLPGMMGASTSSGEALKQRESGLLAKVRKAQVKMGNSHEDMARIAVAIHNTFAPTQAPVSNDWRCVWRDAQIRNEKMMIENALMVRDIVGDREVLRLIGEVYGYGMEKQDEIIEEKQAAAVNAMTALAGSLPGFDNFNL